MLYELLKGKNIFAERSLKKEHKKSFNFKIFKDKKLSKEASTFLNKCLKVDPFERLNVLQLLKDPFVTQVSIQSVVSEDFS